MEIKEKSSFLDKKRISLNTVIKIAMLFLSDPQITTWEFLQGVVSPVQSTCQSLELSGMILRSVDKVQCSSFGHLHDQVIYVVPDFGSPQKQLIPVML